MGFFSSVIFCNISQTVQYVPHFSTVLERASLVVLLIGWLFVGCLCLGSGRTGFFFQPNFFAKSRKPSKTSLFFHCFGERLFNLFFSRFNGFVGCEAGHSWAGWLKVV